MPLPGVVLFAYPLFHLRSGAPGVQANRIAARVNAFLACSVAASVPLALGASALAGGAVTMGIGRRGSRE
ncbi:hypothetical protein [uncultured Sphingomonas sp.]|uniref:hypothetical protein n=1 Tax=uncultured Sphingomonas sp. TaxID=158754 RepID=UPI0035CA8AC9